MKHFEWWTDSEDSVVFHGGDLAVSEDGSSERTIRLTPKAALGLANVLENWAMWQNYDASMEGDR